MPKNMYVTNTHVNVKFKPNALSYFLILRKSLAKRTINQAIPAIPIVKNTYKYELSTYHVAIGNLFEPNNPASTSHIPNSTFPLAINEGILIVKFKFLLLNLNRLSYILSDPENNTNIMINIMIRP